LSWDRRHKAPFPLFEFWQLGAPGDDLPELVGLLGGFEGYVFGAIAQKSAASFLETIFR